MSLEPSEPSEAGDTNRPPAWRPQLHRRDVLRGGLYTAAGLGVASLLSACNSDSGTSATSGATYPLARPDDPVTLPIFDDNQPIADGLKVEDTGALKVLNYADYMAPGVKKDFGEKYGVEVQVTPYNNYDEMLNKLNAPGAAYDLVFPGPSVLSRMVYGKLLQPLNQSYLPNLKNAWPEYQDPWYDQKSNYTVPYTVYTTGIGYRADRIDNADEQGYMMIWNGDYKGKVGVLDDAGESLAMAMLAWGITGDINTDNQDYVNQARDKLIELINLVDVKIDITQYETIATGKFTVHQAWSGDLIAGQYYVGPGVSPDVLGFWQPKATPDRTVGNDNIAIPKSSPSPVLAHTFLNYILDNDVSLKNFGWNGYQPPLTKLSAKYLIDKGYVPENLLDAVVVPKDFGEAKQFYEVPVAVQNMWLTAFQEFQSGGS